MISIGKFIITKITIFMMQNGIPLTSLAVLVASGPASMKKRQISLHQMDKSHVNVHLEVIWIFSRLSFKLVLDGSSLIGREDGPMNIFETFKKRKCVCQNKYKLRYNEEIKQWECYCQSGIDDGHGNCYCANNQYWDSQERFRKQIHSKTAE